MIRERKRTKNKESNIKEGIKKAQENKRVKENRNEKIEAKERRRESNIGNVKTVERMRD